MQPKNVNPTPVTTSWIVRNFEIPPSTIKFHASSGYLPGFREAKTPKLWKFWLKDVKAYVARRKHVLPAH